MEDLSYETAKKLKDAGFPQGTHVQFSHPRLGIQEVEGSYVHLPTLEELIEVFERGFIHIGIEKHSNEWRVGTLKTGGVDVMLVHTNLKEAVAALILSLVAHGLLTLTK